MTEPETDGLSAVSTGTPVKPHDPGDGGAVELVEFATRFLFPFFIDPESVQKVVGVLARTEVAGFGNAWIAGQPHATYRDELLGHVAAYLFPDCGPGGCGYLQLAEKPSNRIFRGVVATLRERTRVEVGLARPAGCEIFLGEQGVGVLSIALRLEGDAIPVSTALDFNYLAADRHLSSRIVMEIPHASSDPKRWAALKEEQRSHIKPAPPLDASIEDRLGAAGGVFTLAELAAFLLQPVSEVGLESVRPESNVASTPFVFAVGRLKADFDFQDPAARHSATPLLGSLAQVEEPSHPGSIQDDLGIPVVFLNRKHAAAAGQLGSTHLVADQPPDENGKEPEFNHERVGRVFNKYFVAHLVGFLQRLVLMRAMRDASVVVTSGHTESASRELARLRSSLLHFAVRGQFTHISTRHAVHRYYQMTREALDVPALWDGVRRSVADLDAAHAAENARKLNEQMAQSSAASVEVQKKLEGLTQGMSASLATGVKLQSMVHIIEIFLVSVYSAHLFSMVLETLHTFPLVAEHEEVLGALHWASPFLVLAAAGVGYLIARRILVHADGDDRPHGGSEGSTK